MGFCDPCPGIPKHLLVEYIFHGKNYQVCILCSSFFVHYIAYQPELSYGVGSSLVIVQVVVGDCEELLIPQDRTQGCKLQCIDRFLNFNWLPLKQFCRGSNCFQSVATFQIVSIMRLSVINVSVCFGKLVNKINFNQIF